MNKPKRPKQLSRKTIYQSDWVNLHLDKVEFPDGRIIDKMHVIDYPIEAVGVVVVNNEGSILLEYAYRYHTGKDGWEIPAGGIDKGESAIKAGEREVKEETGYNTKNHKVIYSYNPSNGSSNQVFHVIFCEITPKNQSSFDKNEVREVKWVTMEEVKKMIQEKEIHDGYTLSALLLYLIEE